MRGASVRSGSLESGNKARDENAHLKLEALNRISHLAVLRPRPLLMPYCVAPSTCALRSIALRIVGRAYTRLPRLCMALQLSSLESRLLGRSRSVIIHVSLCRLATTADTLSVLHGAMGGGSRPVYPPLRFLGDIRIAKGPVP
jgi:hypothetical protein